MDEAIDETNESPRNSNDDDEQPIRPRLICSARFVLTLMCLVAVFNVSCVRIGLSIAMVCMVRTQQGNSDGKEGDFSWSSTVKGYLMSAVFYGFIVGPFIAGYLSFKYGGKIVFVMSSMVSGIMNFFLPEGAKASSILFFVIRVFTGLFASFTFPAFYDLLGHWTVPEERQLLIGGALIGIPLASILNFPINSFICEYCGWVWIFYIFGLWMVLCGIVYIFTVYNYPENCPFATAKEVYFLKIRIPKVQKVAIPWKNIGTSLPIYAFIIMHFCINYVYLSLITGLPLLMEEVYRLPLEQNGLLSATPFIGSLVMRILISLFFEKLRTKLNLSKNAMRKIFISVGAAFVSLFLIIVTFLSCPYRYWALGCFVGASSSLELCITGGYLLSVLDLCPSYVNVVTGIANSIGNAAGLICPVVNGWITVDGTKDQWNIVFYITVTVLMICTLFYLIFGQNHLQHWGMAPRYTETPLPRASIVH